VLREAFAKEETRAAIGATRASLARNLAEFNIKPEEFTEVLQIWDEVVAASGEAEKLFTYFDNNLERFIALRQEPERGTEPHSPLPWWKWLMIAAVWTAAATAIATCVIYYTCTYWDAIVTAAVGAIGFLILFGC